MYCEFSVLSELNTWYSSRAITLFQFKQTFWGCIFELMFDVKAYHIWKSMFMALSQRRYFNILKLWSNRAFTSRNHLVYFLIFLKYLVLSSTLFVVFLKFPVAGNLKIHFVLFLSLLYLTTEVHSELSEISKIGQVVTYFRKKLHLRRLAGFWIHLWTSLQTHGKSSNIYVIKFLAKALDITKELNSYQEKLKQVNELNRCLFTICYGEP